MSNLFSAFLFSFFVCWELSLPIMSLTGVDNVKVASVDEADNKRNMEAASVTDSLPSTDNYTSALLVSAEDDAALDAKYTTSRKELWSFYAYYIGNSGLGPFNYAPNQLQNILSLAATDASNGLCGNTGQPGKFNPLSSR